MAATKTTTAAADDPTPVPGTAAAPAPAATPEEIAAAAPGAVADPAPATTLEEASGAIIEPAITTAVDVGHEAVDANPRTGTTALQNGIDFNDAKRASPSDEAFAGQGIDRSVYGRVEAAGEDRAGAPEAPGTTAARSGQAKA